MLASFFATLLLVLAGYSETSPSQITQTQTGTDNTETRVATSAIAELKEKAGSGDAAAQYELGRAFEVGNGVRQSPEQAAIWYRKAANQGNAKAQNSLGVLYLLGDGVEKDKKEAIRWYHMAARQGEASAMFNLGAAYYNGEGVATVDDIMAYAWFILSGEAGSQSGRDAVQRSKAEHGPGALNDARFAIGQMYEEGKDLPQNFSLASTWYRKAAEQGHTQAQVYLALLALKAKDYGEARQWCERAAKDRNAGGFFCLGYLDQRGLGGNPNYKDALKSYQEAARLGNSPAMLALGRMFANGDGTRQDRSQGFVWFVLAARRGNTDSVAAANSLRASMNPKEWKDAQKKLKAHGFDPQKVNEILKSAESQP